MKAQLQSEVNGEPLPQSAARGRTPLAAEYDDGLYRYVREYWLFDPDGYSGDVPLLGHRLCGEHYGRIAVNANGRLPSEVLCLELHVDDGRLRFHDPATGEDLKTFDEEADGRAAAEQRVAEEAAPRAAAERTLARLRRGD